MKAVQPIHPFPARMAPEIALDEVASLAHGSVILDPMAGSGTVLHAASEMGHRAIGFDVDPLAVLMARVWTTPLDVNHLRESAKRLILTAAATSHSVMLPWIDDDPETCHFVDFWFGEEQQDELRKIAFLLHQTSGPIGDALRIAFSRVIITKDRGASLARDVSHSRPHRVRDRNDFLVIPGFQRSVEQVARRLEGRSSAGTVDVRLGDARHLASVGGATIDGVITSPPYLNAIDYLRGHKLTLVWLGYRISDVRIIRAGSIGLERGADDDTDIEAVRRLIAPLQLEGRLPQREVGIFERYGLDMFRTLAEIQRVLKPGGKAVLVVGNSTVRGVFIENTRMISAVAEYQGLRLVDEKVRELPPARRYLPPPTNMAISGLEKRMRTESILTFLCS